MGDDNVVDVVLNGGNDQGVFELIGDIITSPPDTAINIVQEALQDVDNSTEDGRYLEFVLKALWNYVQANLYLQTKANFEQANRLFSKAAEGFKELGIEGLEQLSIGMAIYAEAIINLQAGNLTRGIELIEGLKKSFEKAGEYSNQFEAIVDLSEPDILFLTALSNSNQMKYSEAKQMFNRSYEKYIEVAKKYFEEDEDNYYLFTGLGYTSLGMCNYSEASRCLSGYEFDTIIKSDTITEEMETGIAYLERIENHSAITKSVLNMIKAHLLMLEVTQEVALILNNILTSTFKYDFSITESLKNKIEQANDYAAGVLEGEIIIKSNKLMLERIRNIERHAKPKKKDFGVFSGAVSCVSFMLLFMLLSWANSTFAMDIEGRYLYSTSMFFSLIVGFGFGALRFKSVLFNK